MQTPVIVRGTFQALNEAIISRLLYRGHTVKPLLRSLDIRALSFPHGVQYHIPPVSVSGMGLAELVQSLLSIIPQGGKVFPLKHMVTDLNETLKIPQSNSIILRMKNESLGWKRNMEVHIFFKGLSRPIQKRKEGGPGEKGFMIDHLIWVSSNTLCRQPLITFMYKALICTEQKYLIIYHCFGQWLIGEDFGNKTGINVKERRIKMNARRFLIADLS